MAAEAAAIADAEVLYVSSSRKPCRLLRPILTSIRSESMVTAGSTVAMAALMAYAHLLQSGDEVEYIWKNPRRPASWLYCIIRYFGILYQLITTGLNSYTPHCNAVLQLSRWANLIAIVASYVFQIMRTYAVCGRSKILAVLLPLLCLPPVVIEIMSAINLSCTIPSANSLVETNLAISSAFAFETIIFIATVQRTWHLVAEQRRLKSPSDNLVQCILRNGALYFGVFCFVDLGQIIFLHLPPTVANASLATFFASLSDPIRWVILCQFILELRARVQQPRSGASETFSTPSISAFKATVAFLHNTVEDDFGESLYPPPAPPRRSDATGPGSDLTMYEDIPLRDTEGTTSLEGMAC